MEPVIFRPFEKTVFDDLQAHVRQIRRAYDWPGMEYHDKDYSFENKFNRWMWNNLPLLVKLHHDPKFILKASELAKEPLKPSYVFLSMYGKEGVCPLHTDRPQCRFTVDLVIDQDAIWPIYVDNKPANLNIGEALFYSGTHQPHFRSPMSHDSKATHCSLAFFHFVPTSWMGGLT